MSSQGYAAALDALLAGLTGPDPKADALAVPALPTEEVNGTSAAAKAARAADAAAFRDLQDWWLNRMIVTSAPLREKLTLFWHGHFATAYSKVRSAHLMYLQNQVFRRQGGADFHTLTLSVAQGGAMMRWLDTAQDKRTDPNENFARELMEIFTLGPGNYTQADVTDAARAFTGWRYDRRTDSFYLDAAQHDTGSKTFLGHTGNLTGTDIIDIVLAQPASARFVAASVWSHFAAPVTPSDPVVSDLVAAYGPAYNLTALLRATFSHPNFLTSTTRQGLVKQPIEWVAGAARTLGLDAHARPLDGATGLPTASGAAAPGLRLASLVVGMGQELMNPPNVGGWPQNSYWLDTASARARLAIAEVLAARADLSAIEKVPASARVDAVAELLAVDGWGPTTAGALRYAAGAPVALVTLALSSPEYALA
jgi:uncharacterized protein (DUF1800 family)